MTVLLTPSAKQQFFDNAGIPASGYKLHTYASGTLVNQATFSNRSGSAANTNPITLDARGEAIIYLTPGVVYDYELRTPAGVSVWTRQGIIADAGDADAVNFIQAGAGAVARSVQDKARERISFEDYGAVGDGVADDTAAIQAAIDANPGKDIYATKPVYKITSRINIINSVRLHAPVNGCEIQQATVDTDHIMIGDGTEAVRNTSLGTMIEGFTFTPHSSVAANFTTGSCIYLNYAAYFTIVDCDFYGKQGSDTRLFRAITMSRASEGIIRVCRGRFFRDHIVYGAGLPGGGSPNAFRTVDVRFESCRFYTAGNDLMHLGEHCNGIFINDCIFLDTGNFAALNINSDPALDGTNFFIMNINVEGGNYANGKGIVVTKGTVVQIADGWIGGIVGTQPAVHFTSGASGCEVIGLRCDFSGIWIDGASCSVKASEISGDNTTTANGIKISNTANDFLIAGCRIRQVTSHGIAITGSPQRGVISGVQFNGVGGNMVSGANFTGGPSVTGVRSNASAAVATAATIALDFGPDMYQVTGAAPNITDINPKAPGRRIQIQAGVGGITLASGVSIIPKGGAASVTVPQFRTIELFCDGFNWFESGGSY